MHDQNMFLGIDVVATDTEHAARMAKVRQQAAETAALQVAKTLSSRPKKNVKIRSGGGWDDPS